MSLIRRLAEYNHLQFDDLIENFRAELGISGPGSAGVPDGISFVYAAGAADSAEIVISVVDGAGSPVVGVHQLLVWLSDSVDGGGLTATDPSTSAFAKSGAGVDIVSLNPKKALIVQTLSTGSYTLEIVDTAKTGYFVGVSALGVPASGVSRQLVTGDFG